jgi:aldose 1-epimerase
MTAEAIASGKGSSAALYPLVPYSNRIRDGRLVFDGEVVRLARNWPGVNHPMHGDGWAHRWEVVTATSVSAEIVYQHERASDTGGWPFRYLARQSYRLESDRLVMRIALENLEDRAVPAGIGLHPFFVRDRRTMLALGAESVWTADAEVLPLERIAVPTPWDFSTARPVDPVTLDNCFDGWDGRASITWPDHSLRLDLEASEPFRHVVIYSPPGQRFFCVEPVSHANDQAGRVPLEPRGVRAGEVVFRLSDL